MILYCIYLESGESVNLFDEDTDYTDSEEENDSGGEIEDDNYDVDDDIYEDEADSNKNEIYANIDVISKEAKTVDDTAQEMDAIYKAKILKFKQMLAGMLTSLKKIINDAYFALNYWVENMLTIPLKNQGPQKLSSLK